MYMSDAVCAVWQGLKKQEIIAVYYKLIYMNKISMKTFLENI